MSNNRITQRKVTVPTSKCSFFSIEVHSGLSSLEIKKNESMKNTPRPTAPAANPPTKRTTTTESTDTPTPAPKRRRPIITSDVEEDSSTERAPDRRNSFSPPVPEIPLHTSFEAFIVRTMESRDKELKTNQKHEVDTIQKELKELKSHIMNLEAGFHKLEDNNKELNQHNQELKDRYDELKDKMSELQDRHELDSRSVDAGIESARASGPVKLREMLREELEVGDVGKRMSQLVQVTIKQELGSMGADVEQLQIAADNIVSRIDALETTTVENIKSLTENVSVKSNVEEIEKLETVVTNLRTDVNGVKENIELRFTTALVTTANIEKLAQLHITESKKDRETDAESIRKIRHDLASFETKLSSSKSTNDGDPNAVQTKVGALEISVDRVEKKLDESCQLHENLENAVNKVEEDIAVLSGEVELMRVTQQSTESRLNEVSVLIKTSDTTLKNWIEATSPTFAHAACVKKFYKVCL